MSSSNATDLARFKWVLFMIGAGLLVLPMAPGLGTDFNTGRASGSASDRSTSSPASSPSSRLAIFFAAYLAETRELIAAGTWKLGPLHLPSPRYMLPILIAWGFSVLVMVGERDLGSSLLFFTLFVVMLWVATQRLTFLLIGVVLFAGAAYIAWKTFGHVQQRVDIWLNPWADPLDDGYQIIQGLYGLSDGGILGTGLGVGDPGTVPAAHNDFIFASIGEELGPRRRRHGARRLSAARRRRAAHRDAHRERVREAARRRSHHDRRHPGVHHRRRRHQGDPAHRHHAAVRLATAARRCSPTTSCWP
ncbi:MAG: FtsW/RodA/SpoVE family cell cycle protein [Ilumatobacteraceae bacterium]